MKIHVSAGRVISSEFPSVIARASISMAAALLIGLGPMASALAQPPSGSAPGASTVGGSTTDGSTTGGSTTGGSTTGQSAAGAPTTSPMTVPAPNAHPPIEFGAEDIRDIRGPIALDPPLWAVYGPYVLGGALAALVSLAAFALMRRRHRGPSAFALAMTRLDSAERELGEGDPARFAEHASFAVRAYIEHRYGARAEARTTEEFLYELSRDGDSPLAQHRVLLGDFLAACDAAKFGGFALERGEMETMAAAARRFVTETWRSREEPKKPVTALLSATRGGLSATGGGAR